MPHIIRLTDRSRTTLDWRCERARYYAYEYEGRGIGANSIHFPLYFGTCVHDGLAAIVQDVNIDTIAATAHKQMLEALLAETTGEVGEVSFAEEQAALVEGLLRGVQKQVWPQLISLYPKIVAVEQEMQYKISDDLLFMSRPDLILEDREGEWHYIEWKSTSSKKEGWVNSWNTAIQLHSTIKAVEQTLGKMPVDVTIVGLYKGYESYGKQNSPFCYGYHRAGNPPFTEAQTLYEYKAGYRRSPTWEMPGGVKAWVEGMPDTILSEQFPMSPPIMIKEELVNQFFEQLKWRESEIAMATDLLAVAADEASKQSILNVSFVQKWDSCQPDWGAPCEFRRLCFGHVTDPLNEGYEWRVPNHPIEGEYREKEASQHLLGVWEGQGTV